MDVFLKPMLGRCISLLSGHLQQIVLPSLAFEPANVAHDPLIEEEDLIYTSLCQVFRFDHSYRCCLWQNLVISTAVNTVVTQNFSIKKHILLPTLNSSYSITSKYVRVGLLAASRFSRTHLKQFISKLLLKQSMHT